MFTNLPRPTLFAHRGASAYAPENTLAAFELAIHQGADAIELDAKLSADGQVVVIHDPTVNRTTGAEGLVGKMTLSELRELDAGSHFDINFRDEPIPSLNEVLEAVGQRIYINIELTNYASMTDSLPEKVAALVRQHGLGQRILISSFNPIALLRARRLLPQVPVGLLAMPGKNGALARSPLGYLLGYQALHPDYTDVTSALVERMHQRGSRVHPYTVNGVEDIRRLLDYGVDGIFTDDPIQARKILTAVNPEAT